ncbi:hypothetical protein BLA29_006686 [Euroglyphus maynei]|uniref:Uncharacterized protein n=1 Tax=Euroglyphus maynei TaxID=6958 RepID=A0A1Y3B5C7_EURMA|nr:hypothetical protein BLA29_006686 [Euroglyphus maynei]
MIVYCSVILPQQQQQQHSSNKATTNRSSTHHSSNDSLNGITKTILIQPTSTTSTTTTSSIMIPDGNELSNQLCMACKQHKSEYWVETKENPEKKPFYPFLQDANELVNGRARVCAQCHLILEIQWDGFENGYVPYNQRVYQLSSSAKRPPTSSLTQLSSVAPSTTTTTMTAPTATSSSSSPAIITQIQ